MIGTLVTVVVESMVKVDTPVVEVVVIVVIVVDSVTIGGTVATKVVTVTVVVDGDGVIIVLDGL